VVSRSREVAVASMLLLAAGLLAACGSGTPSAGSSSTSSSTTVPTTTSSSTTSSVPPTTTSVPPLAHGVQGTDAQIPWSQVGSGWTLATWQPTATVTASGEASLFLVDPAGGRYLVSTDVPADQQVVAWGTTSRVALLANWFVTSGGADLTGVDLATGTTLYQTHLTGVGFQVDAESGDGQRLLLTSDIVNTSNDQVTELDLTSGATLHQFQVTGPAYVAYTLPQGLDLVISSGGQLRRTGLDGTTQLTFQTNFSSVGSLFSVGSYPPDLYSPDGTELVVGASKGIAVMLNSGTLGSQVALPTAGQDSGCDPVEWWTTGTVLASCGEANGSELFLVPLSGGAPTLLGQTGPVFGDLFQAGGGVFAQSGACGTLWIDQLGASKTFSQITVPGLQPSEIIVGATASALEVLGRGACDESPGQVRSFALVSFDPADDTSSFQLGPSANGGNVLSALAYGTEFSALDE
jgi:hypothetical protein